MLYAMWLITKWAFLGLLGAAILIEAVKAAVT